MTILKPTKKEFEEHMKECAHCRHWMKTWKKWSVKNEDCC